MYHWHQWVKADLAHSFWPQCPAIEWRFILARSRDGFDSRDNAEDMPGREPTAARDLAGRASESACPWCGSSATVRVQRGFVGPTDDRNQYLNCNACNRLTFEIISKTVRDMRVGQFRVGGTYRDTANQTKYTITRVLKVGMNECLLYVKPLMRTESGNDRTRDRD